MITSAGKHQGVSRVAQKSKFRTTFAENIFRLKYANSPEDTWDNLAIRLIDDVCGNRSGTEPMALMSKEERAELTEHVKAMKFIPGGRYLYYAGRKAHFWNNCFLLRAEEDTREEWAAIVHRAMLCLCSGGGIGVDYSVLRPSGRTLSRTGGVASGPIPLMKAVNEIGRNVIQGGSRRSAVYASLNWQHEDIEDFIHAKDWSEDVIALKAKDFNFTAPLDMTNISINWDDDWLNDRDRAVNPLWIESVKRMLKTGEPGHSYNFGANRNETLRNAYVIVRLTVAML
jgi:ribonucleoside-diphosphate reductase alpha chain